MSKVFDLDVWRNQRLADVYQDKLRALKDLLISKLPNDLNARLYVGAAQECLQMVPPDLRGASQFIQQATLALNQEETQSCN